MKRFLKLALVPLMLALLAFAVSPTFANGQSLQLNLSHIECTDEGVEVHFLLLNVPDGITPGTLTYTYGTIEPGAHTGNVWHYTDYLPDGYYNITSASVVVDGQTVQLHNPGVYSGEYNCSPDEASVDVQLGVCQWTQQTGSVTPVSFTIDHATITVVGPGGPYVLTSSTTLALSPGSYSYSWKADEGYEGSGEGSFTVLDCSQIPASVEISIGTCEWDGEESTTIVSFTLGEGISVILAGKDGVVAFDESTSFALPPGYYYWEAISDEGYYIVGPSEGEFAVASCEPGVVSVAVTFGVCEFGEETSNTEVTFTLSGNVAVTLTGPDGFELELTETATLELFDGHYEWTAKAGEGSELEGEDSGEFDLSECEPPDPLKCPICGAPIRETKGESMGIAWFSDVPCDPENPCNWYKTLNPWVKLWTSIESFFTQSGATTPLQEVVTANGDVCYVSFFRDPKGEGDFILWGPDGYGDRFRDHVPDSERALHKYSACSIFPSWCDTRLVDGVGYAMWLPGHTVSDWAQFLLDNGFFPDEEHRGTASLEWAYALRANGYQALMTWDGDLDSLPLYPLPPR